MSKEKKPLMVMRVSEDLLGENASINLLGEKLNTLLEEGESVVLVHGGEQLAEQWLQRRLAEPTPQAKLPFHGSELAVMMINGTNLRFVSRLVSYDVPAVGLSGADNGWISGDFLNIARLGRVGGPPKLSLSLVESLLSEGYIPVVGAVGIGPDGHPLIFRADMLAQVLAVSLQADSLSFVTASDLFLEEKPWDLPMTIDYVGVNELIARRSLHSDVIPKLHASLAAMQGGVKRVTLGDMQAIAHGDMIEILPSLHTS